MGLSDISDEMLLLLETFEKYQVKYMIVGGFAVNRYGFKRTTGDVDIFLKDSLENRKGLIAALDEMGYGKFDMLLTVPIIAGYCEVMMDDGIFADLMTELPGLEQENFDEYYEVATVDHFGDYVVRFLHYNHLMRTKEATTRPKDKIDAEALRQIRNPLSDNNNEY